MEQLVLLAWVWVISGGVALYAYSDELTERVDVLTAVVLVLTWPYWLVQYHRARKEKEEKKLKPIRIETRDHRSKGK